MFKKERKDKMIQIRVTEKQKKTIIELAKKNNNENVTDFILELVEKYYKDNCN